VEPVPLQDGVASGRGAARQRWTPPRANLEPVAELAATLDAPLLADPLSGLRSPDAGVAGGYAGYLQQEVTASWPSPDLVVRVGASPTSKRLRQYLRDADARDILVDPAGGWREATFTATDHVVASVPNLTEALADALPADAGASEDWSERFRTAERRYWDLLDGDRPPEAEVVLGAIRAAPAGAPVVLGNSTPIRDADRFLEPSPADRQLLGNRGASGIDGTISTAVGAATAADGPAVCVLGDLATLHDATGLSALERTEADCTIVVIDNDGGGIFHALPIAEFDPPFTDWFRTPHGSDLSELAGAVGIRHRVAAVGSAADEIRDAVQTDGPELVVVHTDAAAHHAQRDALDERVVAALSAD
jgi:2-succinyl-5-enolpyruvyl-6-hydroxy-3-cyclohexene-1-carboxylate synthase